MAIQTQRIVVGHIEPSGVIPEPLQPLSRRQFDALRLIYEHLANHGAYPSHSEVATSLNVGRSRAQRLLGVLEHKGYLSNAEGAHRGIRFTEIAWKKLTLEGVDVRLRDDQQLSLFRRVSEKR